MALTRVVASCLECRVLPSGLKDSVTTVPVTGLLNFISSLPFVSDSLEHRCTNTYKRHILRENMSINSYFYLLIIYGSAHIVRKMLGPQSDLKLPMYGTIFFKFFLWPRAWRLDWIS